MIATVEALVEAGWAGSLDRCFPGAMGRIANERNPLVLLGALAASRFTTQKHVCADLSLLAGRAVDELEGEEIADLEWPALSDWIPVLEASPLVSDGSVLAPLVLAGARLYLYRYWDYERRLASALCERASRPVSDVDEELLAGGLVREFSGASPEDLQRQAASVAVRHRLAVISGGPGTGKTTAVSRILSLLGDQAASRRRDLPRVALLAPTGKAAARLLESIREAGERLFAGQAGDDAALVSFPDQASTIHRALGYRPDRPTRFRHGVDNPLATDAVIVDEASMVDLALMTKLIEAVPADARLILLGDRDQLSSVDAGSVLGDICDVGGETRRSGGPATGLGACIVHLTRSYRFGRDSDIGRLARAINDNRADEAVDLLTGAGGDSAVQLVEERDPAVLEHRVSSKAAQKYRQVLGEADPLERLRRLGGFRVLCAHRRGPLGAEQLGTVVERRLAELGVVAVTDGWYDGKPVMITSNDYQLGLFNGDTGLTCADPATGQLRIVFAAADAGLRSITPSRLAAHESVYATTVHKAQGSEFDEVAVVLPPRISPVVTRELLYTAVTRARERVTIYGTEAVLRQAIGARTVRCSGLRERLWG